MKETLLPQKVFKALKEKNGWQDYIESHLIEGGKYKYIITFKGHESFKTKVMAKKWNKNRLNKIFRKIN